MLALLAGSANLESLPVAPQLCSRKRKVAEGSSRHSHFHGLLPLAIFLSLCESMSTMTRTLRFIYLPFTNRYFASGVAATAVRVCASIPS